MKTNFICKNIGFEEANKDGCRVLCRFGVGKTRTAIQTIEDIGLLMDCIY